MEKKQDTNKKEWETRKDEFKNKKANFFERFSARITMLTGSTAAFSLAFGMILAWLISGPFFGFSETWQLVINTCTTIITFLMVFLIQKTQNKESLSIQLKLNELIAAHEFASNRLVNAEEITEDELKVIKKYYVHLSKITQEEESLHESHSIDEAEEHHERKKKKEGE